MEKTFLKNQWIFRMKFLLCIVMLTMLSISVEPALALGNQTADRLALLALKDQLVVGGSPGAGALSSWNDSLHFCDWQGVRCGRKHQRVITLNLVGLKLSGIISHFVGNLSFLREADFSDNKLKGNIPIEFGHLRRLRYLNLSRNSLQGQLPVELTNGSYLQVLSLSHNNLTGKIPWNVGGLKNLIKLSLSFNQLSGSIPSSFGNLSSLELLTLAFNHLEGVIPSALGRLSNLQVLYLSTNNLSGIVPPAIYNLSSITYFSLPANQLSGSLPPELGFLFSKLEEFYIGSNQFTGTIPRSVSNISTLQYFDVFENNFFGSVPDDLGNLKNLRSLIIDYNHLGSGKDGDLGFISSLTNCSQLQELVIHRNRFGGVLPDSVSNLSTQLQLLYIGENHISGSIPKGIGNLFNLNIFHSGYNFLTGNIPGSIGKLRNLEGLHLAENSLSGKIPSSVGNLTRLSRLDLSMNNFEGRIPQTLGKCKSMQKLVLSKNKLIGPIPDQLLAALESLIGLSLAHNNFTGILPSDIGSLKHLGELYVHHNNFYGEIPKELGEVPDLTIVYMQRNSFEGSIPQSFGNLRALQTLDLSDNNLSGVIPPEIAKLPFLVSLNLSLNHLEGEVPQGGVFKNVSGFLFFQNRKLCGGIPEIKLPKCFSEKKKKVLSTNFVIAMTLSILLGSILAVLLVYLFCKQKGRKGLIPVASFEDAYQRLSYKELLDATQGFSSSNLIGSGSFGSVYKGILHQLEKKPVAVKVLNLQNRGAAKSFVAEYKALTEVRHRNLLKIITSCSSIDYQGNDFKALVLEFMSNGSLDSWLHEQHESRYLNLAQRLDIAVDVANAIDYLHHDCEMLIVHCDIKPTNVLLDDDMVAHVSDFGLAKLLSTETSNVSSDQTISSMLKGTIGYIAPEYGMVGTVSREGDIYSYGILLLEMMTGRRPTDDLFQDGLSLHNFCKMALPERLMEILDSRLLEETGGKRQKLSSQQNMEGEIRECLVSITKVGVACSVETPDDRMRIKDAIVELNAAKARLVRTGVYIGD